MVIMMIPEEKPADKTHVTKYQEICTQTRRPNP